MSWDPLAGLFGPLKETSAEEVLAGLKAFAANPTANPTALMLSAAIVVLFLLVVVLFVLYVLMPPSHRIVKERRYSSPPPSPAGPVTSPVERRSSEPQVSAASSQHGAVPSGGRRLIGFFGSGLGLALLAIAGLTAIYGATSTDSFCFDACHASSEAARAADKEGHASCSQCHQRSGVAGVVPNSVARVRMVVATIAGGREPASLPVRSEHCLRCHEGLLAKTAVSDDGLAVAHKHIVESGDPCTSCHPLAGHQPSTYEQGMARCIVCHDTKTASGECPVCHRDQPIRQAKAGTPVESVSDKGFHYRLVDASRPYCDDCHDVAKECDPCHGGIRMPHDDAFITGGHARQAAFEGKMACWKCHAPEDDCGSPCHTGFERTGVEGHPEMWRTEHAKAPRTSTCGCHQWYSQRTGPMCPLCH